MINNLITHNKTRIILSHERGESVSMDIYPSNHLLTYVREGILEVKHGNEVQSFTKGEMVLLKKFTHATISKNCSKDGDKKFSSIVFTFHEDLMEEALANYTPGENVKLDVPSQSIIAIPENPILKHFIQSLQLFFEEGLQMDQNLARLKTHEALLGILKENESLFSQFRYFSIRNKADLFYYMNAHYLENKKLSDFARDSGRSLSTFKKDFQEIFQTTPAEWLKRKRLEHAYRLLTTTSGKPSEIYLECGFEDLAHFSKSFKTHFKINPSEVA